MRVAVSLSVIVATATASIAGVALAADSNNASSATPSQAPTVAVAAVQPDAAAAFKLLRTTPPSVMPADVAEAVASPAGYGRNSALARAIKTATGTGWVIPGNGYLCIAIPDPGFGWGTSCVPTAVAAQRGLSIGLTSASGKTAETLLVPDGAGAAKIDGPVSTTAPVASAASKTKGVKVSANGVAIAHTNAPGSLRVKR
ncbi:MAG: hypothetical protein JWR63_567 [Conexibacter sp.]|nr:hypothetical protein [Conexibacter sp.]